MSPTVSPTSRFFEPLQHAIKHSYSPYSNFAVAAVILGEDGQLYAGSNIENAAYPQGHCAEATAISLMIMSGERRIKEVAVMGHGPVDCTPCGGCRQRIREFADDSTAIHVFGEEGLRFSTTLGALLPKNFGPDNLKCQP